MPATLPATSPFPKHLEEKWCDNQRPELFSKALVEYQRANRSEKTLLGAGGAVLGAIPMVWAMYALKSSFFAAVALTVLVAAHFLLRFALWYRAWRRAKDFEAQWAEKAAPIIDLGVMAQPVAQSVAQPVEAQPAQPVS